MNELADLSRKIEADLQKLLKGDVRFDAVSRLLYSTAACNYRIKPLGVVAPKDAADVHDLLRYAHARGISVTARGAGSSVTGSALGEGVIIDFSRYMNRIIKLDAEAFSAEVEPGVVCGDLNKKLLPCGLFFPPDPSSSDFCTIGGMIGNNASGARSVKYGSTKDHILSLDVAMANGEGFSVKSVSAGQDAFKSIMSDEGDLGHIYRQTLKLILENENAIEEDKPKCPKNSSGYNLNDVLGEGKFDLNKLICGSEGTLGLVTRAQLALTNLPEAKATALAFFYDLKESGIAVNEILKLGPSIIEIMDNRFMEMMRKRKIDAARMLEDGAEAVLLVEFDGSCRDSVQESLHMMKKSIAGGREPLAFCIKEACEPKEQENLWAVRKAAVPMLSSIEGPKRPVPFIEDCAVSPNLLPQFIKGLQDIFADHGVQAAICGHAGDGNLHVRPLLNIKEPSDVNVMRVIAGATCELVANLKGTLSAEHGDGLCRTPFLPAFFKKTYPLFAKVKKIFDPKGILNPGKVIPNEGQSIADNLRWSAAPLLNDPKSPLSFSAAARSEMDKCHGCGACRTFCPLFQAFPDEAASARSKANLAHALAAGGSIASDVLPSEEFQRAVKLCLNCRLCRWLCPTGVDVPLLCIELRRALKSFCGAPKGRLSLDFLPRVSQIGSFLSPLANIIVSNGATRYLMEKAFGIDKRRELPRFRRRAKLNGRAAKGGPAISSGSVIYFAGCYPSYHDVEGLAGAVEDLLGSLGHNLIAPEMKCCGAPKLACGSIQKAAQDAQVNMNALYPYIKEGIPIVTTCPTCAVTLKNDYPLMLASEESNLLSGSVYHIAEYLSASLGRGALGLVPGAAKGRVAYHSPCHLRPGGLADEEALLLSLIPGLEVVRLGEKCCGMAGTFGLKRENFELSMKIGEPLFHEIARSGADLVATSCPTCALQFKQAGFKNVVHPLILLKVP